MPLSDVGGDSNGSDQVYIGGKLDLDGLDPGIYELNVSAKELGSKKIAQRTAVFGIE